MLRSMGTTAPAQTTVDLMFLLQQASHALATELTAELAELGVTPREHCVLTKAMVGERTQSELAELAALDKTTMVVTVDQLEKAGLAHREPSSTDRRARVIRVTREGERVARKAQGIVDGIFDDVLAALPPAQRRVFVEGLVRLADTGGRLSTPVHTERPVRRRAPQAKHVVS
jgi:MarR family transcriptional regulator, transcriptional regulator for hemolysin